MLWDQNTYLNLMLQASNTRNLEGWGRFKPTIENELLCLLLMLEWLVKMRSTGEMNTEQALIHIDIQKNTMRMRLISILDFSVEEADNTINNAIDCVRKELCTKMDWNIL